MKFSVKKCARVAAGGMLLAAVFFFFTAVSVLRTMIAYADHDLVATVECRGGSSGSAGQLVVNFALGPLRGQCRSYPLTADEWVFEGRIAAWKLPARLVGVRRYFQYERISGRYLDIAREKTAPREVYALADGPDPLWQFFYRQRRWVPFLDAAYGISAFVPFEPGHVFQVHITQTGFLIKNITPAPRRSWWHVG
ncbi:MAG: hypothetical protein NC924_10055 [Candidatus Omnitrophica bacterium]|nr:hypothetical protein [Candidatus Omnitrophota bacterium]